MKSRALARDYMITTTHGLARWSELEPSPPIALEAVFCIFPANRAFFSVTHRADRRCVDAFFNEEFLYGVGATIAKAQVVFFAASVVAIPIDSELEASMAF
jgi:hypothetical protein